MSLYIETDDKLIEISNNNNKLIMTTETKCKNAIEKVKTQKQILGVYGLLKVKNQKYLVCVETADKIGVIKNCDVFEIKKVIIEPLYSKTKSDTKLIKMSFEVPGYYYSTYSLHKGCFDIEDNANNTYNSTNDADGIESVNKDNMFLFNYKPLQNLKELIDNRSSLENTINCIQGYVKIVYFNDTTAALISRRCPKRLGMRYMLRGADENGYCANFVETEQIIHNENHTSSFIQIRGSIPILWGHKLSLKWNPTFTYKKSDIIVKAHEIVKNLYDNVHYLNLINDQNHERILNKHYKQDLVNHQYEHTNYDYKKMKFAKCKSARDAFLEEIAPILNSFDFSTKNKKQKGVIRTNCIDCLDRTNIVQYFISKYMLKRQLNEFNIDENMCLAAFENAYVENGNFLSKQYAGTNSLQSEIIKNKELTVKGKLADLQNSITRYYKNRFTHGQLQQGYNVITDNTYKMKCVEKTDGKNILAFVFLLLLFSLHFFVYKKCENTKIYAMLLFTAFLGFLLLFIIFQDMFLDQ